MTHGMVVLSSHKSRRQNAPSLVLSSIVTRQLDHFAAAVLEAVFLNDHGLTAHSLSRIRKIPHAMARLLLVI